ncbi:MAG: DUF1553 domain-containing protein [Planctomycetota bacterium]|nr:MAG: DUF1553 domain-containing protein [Planctomycetota bacterium]
MRHAWLGLVRVHLFASMMCGLAMADEIRLLPGAVPLTGREARQQLVVQKVDGDVLTSQVSSGVTFTSDHPEIVQVSATGELRPVADGAAIITAQVGEQKCSTQVTVAGSTLSHAWSFTNDVLPVLSKSGCNTGGCHGALAGKGGFRLSLNGYNPEADHFNTVKQDRGRRVELAEPGRSLFLIKPTGAVAHKGGLRFETDSLEYRILSEWIAQGASPPTSTEALVDHLEILPGRSRLAKDEKIQMLVRAHFKGGETRDVTRWVKWTSSNEAVCRVDHNGLVSVIGPGEGAITAWYSSLLTIARITSPYPHPVDPALFAALKPKNFIDEAVNRQLQSLKLPPSPVCDDAEFLRRAFIDTIGTLPTADEVRAFLVDTSADKREKLIDKLLARPEFVDYWTYRWSDVLMLNGNLLRPQAVKAYYTWLKGHVAANTPWDQIVREILTATGGSLENGATNFYAINQTPEDMTENACQAFLGLSIGCAKCHNHPLEKWTNDQYYAMANMFSRVKAKGWGGEPRNGDGNRTLYVSTIGDLVQPRTGKPQPPTPLDGTPLPIDAPDDRRIQLATWMTSPENPYFARSITNRVWKAYFGVGLIESVDDLRVSNPASNEELMTAAAKFLVENKFDLKALMKQILLSEAYQRSSEPLPGNQDEQRFYSRYYPRRMMAEVLLDGVSQVTAVPSEFTRIAFLGSDFQNTDFYPKGTRAIQLYDSSVDSQFLQKFGRNQRRIVCECERSDEPSMVQALHLANGDTVNKKLKATDGRVAQLVELRKQGMADSAIIDEVYLAGLSRYPTAQERQNLSQILTETPPEQMREAIEDLFWAVVSSREFLFNH